jgi:hypothetical protein
MLPMHFLTTDVDKAICDNWGRQGIFFDNSGRQGILLDQHMRLGNQAPEAGGTSGRSWGNRASRSMTTHLKKLSKNPSRQA